MSSDMAIGQVTWPAWVDPSFSSQLLGRGSRLQDLRISQTVLTRQRYRPNKSKILWLLRRILQQEIGLNRFMTWSLPNRRLMLLAQLSQQ